MRSSIMGRYAEDDAGGNGDLQTEGDEEECAKYL